MTTLDQALMRWTTKCRTWQELAQGHQPHLGAFLAGWFCRDTGVTADTMRCDLRDSFRAGWDECEMQRVLNDRTEPSEAHSKHCPHAKSQWTPCYVRDGDVALTGDGKCVGCGETP